MVWIADAGGIIIAENQRGFLKGNAMFSLIQACLHCIPLKIHHALPIKNRVNIKSIRQQPDR